MGKPSTRQTAVTSAPSSSVEPSTLRLKGSVRKCKYWPSPQWSAAASLWSESQSSCSSGATKKTRKNSASGTANPIPWEVTSRGAGAAPIVRSLKLLDLDLAVETLDPGRALLVDLLPVLEHEFLLQLGGVLGEHARNLAAHRHLGIGRHDQIGRVHQRGLHLGSQRRLDQLEGELAVGRVLDDVDCGLEGDGAFLRGHELDRHATRFQDLDGVEIAGRDVDLALLEQGRERAGIGGDRGEIGLQLLDRLEAWIDIGFRAAAHLGDLDQPAGPERRVEIGDADAALELGLPQIGPGGWRRLDGFRIVGEADDLEERGRAHRLLCLGDQVLVIGALLDWIGLNQVLADRDQSGA